MKVYLAGPITGESYKSATDWRQYMIDYLPNGITALSPLRGKYYLEKFKDIADSYENISLSSSRGITTRDRFDVMSSDVIFVNLLGAKSVSIGTVMEIAWADILRKPIILVMEDESNIHEHAMIREVVGFRVNNIDDGIKILCAISEQTGH